MCLERPESDTGAQVQYADEKGGLPSRVIRESTDSLTALQLAQQVAQERPGHTLLPFFSALCESICSITLAGKGPPCGSQLSQEGVSQQGVNAALLFL